MTFTAANGDGAENCCAPFSGYWAGSQAERLNGQNLKLVPGISKRVLRGVLIKQFRSDVRSTRSPRRGSCPKFQHSEDVQDAACMSGLHNEVNRVTQSLYGRG